jgi:flagellar M-ring protein FliF
VELARNVSLAVAVVMGLGVVGLLLLRRRRRATAEAAPAGAETPATPEARRQELLDRFIDTARTDPDRAAAAFGLLVGPAAG